MQLDNYHDLTFKIIENNDATPELDKNIRNGLAECFPKDFEHYSKDRVWHSEPEWIVLALTSDGEIAAHISMVERTVTVGESSVPVKVCGPGGVFVRAQWRKTGLTDRIMRLALEESQRRGLQAGLLFCLEALAEKVYGRMDWERVRGTTFMTAADGKKVSRPDKDIAMTIPLSIDTFPMGDIDLNGPDW